MPPTDNLLSNVIFKFWQKKVASYADERWLTTAPSGARCNRKSGPYLALAKAKNTTRLVLFADLNSTLLLPRASLPGRSAAAELDTEVPHRQDAIVNWSVVASLVWLERCSYFCICAS